MRFCPPKPVLALFLWISLAIPCAWAEESQVTQQPSFTAEQIEFFESNVRPVLVEHCFDCHSTDAKELEAGLYVDSREGILKGGESGPAIVVGKPDDSELIAAVRYESTEMPPNQKLSNKDIRSLEQWVEMGAPWPQVTSSPGLPRAAEEIDWQAAKEGHWAWRNIQHPVVPELSQQAQSQQASQQNAALQPIDRFVVARRQAAQSHITTNGLAEPRILVRRIYVDLVGRVPSPAEADGFVKMAAMDRQRAVEQLVDQLLQSPLYGQRWARHWLDVARYSDGRGGFLDNQSLDHAWRYRDWVVQALNDDMPIDEFLRLQIAGDLIAGYKGAVATGFFAVGPTYRSDGGDPDSVAQAKGETLDDRIDTLTRGLLGITGSCARCHDHKFDPIPQQDYYSLAGVFNNSTVHNAPLAEAEVVKRADDHRKRINDTQKKIKDFDKKLKKEKREPTEAERVQRTDWEQELETLKQNPPPSYDVAHALRESGDKDMHVALRGNLRKTGDLAPRRFLRIVAGEHSAKFDSGSGRLELADAIVDPNNPLTTRVFVNRIWMHHFGNGLVRTPSNFGTLGESPTHPKLLDWLATDFMDHGWSLKRLHRQIVTSQVYQLSGQFQDKAFGLDGDNRFLWRFSPRRMDVEVWRDSLLAVTGDLDESFGGPSQDNIAGSKRRTLYAKVSRNGDVFASDAFLRRFDFPLMRATVAQRPKSIVPQQYLFLLNSPFIVERAKKLVSKLQAKQGDDGARIRLAYRLLFGREVGNTEMQVALDFLAQGKGTEEETEKETVQLDAWVQYAQALLSSNEFMYVR